MAHQEDDLKTVQSEDVDPDPNSSQTQAWIFFGEGRYNRAYVNPSQTQVLKVQIKKFPSDEAERSVRLWNQINSRLSSPAEICECKVSDDQKTAEVYPFVEGHQASDGRRIAWISPFIEGHQASDPKMRTALIDIFNASGRIIIDAPASKNFITTALGEVICVDIGMALQLESRKTEFYSDKDHRRKSSDISLKVWPWLVDNLQPFFEKCKPGYPQTVNTIKALLFIKQNRPDIVNVDFLKRNLELTHQLAQGYDVQYESNKVIGDALRGLDRAEDVQYESDKVIGDALRDLDRAEKVPSIGKLERIKESCRNELSNYIKSRGALNSSGVFSSSLRTRIFRNKKLTVIKVQHANLLIKSIDQSISIKELIGELKKIFHKVLNLPELGQATFNSDFMRSIKLCGEIISTVLKQMPEAESSNSSSNLSAP